MHICIYACFHKLYLHIYAYMPFIYINSERRYYVLSLLFPSSEKKTELEIQLYMYPNNTLQLQVYVILA